jgi:hypothetical protein
MMRTRLACLLIIALAAPGAAWSNTPTNDAALGAERHVSKFLDLFSEVKCTEYVEQSKLSKKGKVEYQERSRFDYLLIAQSSGGELTLQESRLEEEATPRTKNTPLLVTNGFATMLLVFHPYYSASFYFSLPEKGVLNGHDVSIIRFRHVKGTRTPTVLMLRGREYPLDLNGIAWINTATGEVERMEAELEFTMEDIGLRTLRTSVDYAPVRFRGLNYRPWLPSQAVIEVETPRQRWRNVHRFTNYQHFAVDTQHQDIVPEVARGPK